jgi:integrase
MLRAALYGYAFNPQQRRSRAPDPGTASALAWLERASLPVSRLSDPQVIRAALDGLCTRLDGSAAAANTIARKRAAFHGTLGYAVELGLLPANPLGLVRWHAPAVATAVDPATVASPAQVRTILAQVARLRPELAAFFGCLYYAALRLEEAVALCREDLTLPAHGRGKIIVSTACPRTGTAWTSTGTPHEPRRLKHRPDGAIRVVPIPPVLARMLRRHLRLFGTVRDGRLFCGTRGGMLSESVYGRAWHAARLAALGPELAVTALARHPYDLRHAALSLWLNATSAPAEVAVRAGNSVRVPHEVYLHCIDSEDDVVSQRIEDALDAGTSSSRPSQCVKASGCAYRRPPRDPCPLYVRGFLSPAHAWPTFSCQGTPGPMPPSLLQADRFHSSCGIIRLHARLLETAGSGPRIAHGTQPTVCVTAPFHPKSR